MQRSSKSFWAKSICIACFFWAINSFVYSGLRSDERLQLTLIQLEEVNTYIEFKINPLYSDASIRLLLTKQNHGIIYNDTPIKNLPAGIGYAELKQALGAGIYEAYLFINDSRILSRRFIVNEEGVVLIESPQHAITKIEKQNRYRQD